MTPGTLGGGRNTATVFPHTGAYYFVKFLLNLGKGKSGNRLKKSGTVCPRGEILTKADHVEGGTFRTALWTPEE